MLLKLKIECVSGWHLEETCIRVIEIDENMDLLDLHEAIQDSVNFDRDHPFVFYLANSPSPFAHKQRLTEDDEWRESSFAEIKIKDLYPLGRKKLYYLFDFGDNWIFEIRKARGAKNPQAGAKYPRVIEAIGPNPEQYPAWGDEE